MQNNKNLVEILKVIKSSNTPISAPKILEVLKLDNPKTHKTTVYRNLEKLLKSKEISKVNSISGVLLYEISSSNHLHLECQDCSKINCVEDTQIQNKLKELQSLAKVNGFEIQDKDINLQGKCSDCN